MNKEKRRGFTLVEIMIVLAIIAMLGSFVGVKIIDQFKKSKVDGTRIQMKQYEQTLQAYYLNHNVYPHTSQGLEALLHKPSVGKIPQNYPDGGYFNKKELVKDPWGNQYRYVCEDYQTYTLSSDGPDGTPDTEDDIKLE